MKNKLSHAAIGAILFFSLVFTFNMRFWEKNQIISGDVTFYYSYLPAIFIYHDLNLNFASDSHFNGLIWPEKTPNGANMIKTTSGLAILYAPFFFMAHALVTLNAHWEPADGYAPIYGLFLLLSTIFYTTLGFVYLRKLLIQYVPDWIVAIVIFLIFFSTNLFYYTLYGAMAHGYLFGLINIFLYCIVNWHKHTTLKNSMIIGLLFGLIVLIRPVHLVLFLLFCFYGVYSLETLREKIRYYIGHIKPLLVFGVCAFLVVSIQLMYWKMLSGNWFYWSYVGEHFFWTKPHIVDGLFGFRKGWYIYTPIMIPATVGLFFVKRISKEWSLVIPVMWLIFTYIIFSWWSWWYGGGFTIRAYIDIYGIMGIGLAALFAFVVQKVSSGILKISFVAVVLVLSAYSSFVIVQYNDGLIHYDSMTKESWSKIFLKLEFPEGYWDTLKQPDYNYAKAQGEDL